MTIDRMNRIGIYTVSVKSPLIGPLMRAGSSASSASWKRKGDHRIAAGHAKRSVAASGNHHVLPLVLAGAIRHRRGLSSGRQRTLPQFASGFEVERSQVSVHGRADEDQISGREDRPAEIGR